MSQSQKYPKYECHCPVDPLELSAAVDFCSTKSIGPVYLKLVNRRKILQKILRKMEVGKIRKIEGGKNICFLTYGPIIKKI